MTKVQDTINIIKILTNENRFSIVSLLAKSKKDLCVNEISDRIGISQSLTSHQLAYLEARGVVKSIRMGQVVCYVLAKSASARRVLSIMKVFK